MIDIHAHVLPIELLQRRSGGDGWWSVELSARGAAVRAPSGSARQIPSEAWNLEQRLELLDRTGITLQLLSPLPLLLDVGVPVEAARDFYLELNQAIGSLVALHPTRFQGLGALPLKYPDVAAEMVHTLGHAGVVGVELPSNVDGLSIFADRYDAMFSELSAHGQRVFVHAHNPRMQSALAGRAAAAASFPIEIAGAVVDAVSSARVSSYSCPMCFSHGGGAFGPSIIRLQHLWERGADRGGLLHIEPLEALRRYWYDSLTFSAESLEGLVRTAGADRIMIGTDHPVSDEEPGWNLEASNLSDPVREQIRETNARRFLQTADD